MNTGEGTTQPPVQPQVDRVSVKPPPFWKTDPRLWFLQLEAQFQIAHITADLTKYNYVLAAIDTDILTQVTDFLAQPPTRNKYEGLKNRLIAIYSDSREKTLKKLLSDVELGDKKPSQLLNEMIRLGGTSVPRELVRTLWLQRLPVQTQTILATSKDSLDDLAKMADQISEIEQTKTYAISSSSNDNLADMIRKLSVEVTELRGRLERTHRRDHSPSRSRSRSRNARNTKHNTTDGMCWYHHKFQKDAKKCSAPCKFFNTMASAEPKNE